MLLPCFEVHLEQDAAELDERVLALWTTVRGLTSGANEGAAMEAPEPPRADEDAADSALFLVARRKVERLKCVRPLNLEIPGQGDFEIVTGR